MEMETLSIKEFEAKAPSCAVIEFLHGGEWLPVDDYDTDGKTLVFESDELEYRVTGNITVRWLVDD